MTSTPADWWQRPYRTFQTNLREIDAGLDVNHVLDRIQELGANTWLLNAGGIVSFYPTSLPYQHPSPWLSERPSRDLVGDAVAAAHVRGVRIIARMDFSKVHSDIAEAHPDWCYRTASGSHQIYNGLHSMCPSGEYYQQRSFDILEEVLTRYPVDGFFFNWFSFNERDYSRRYYGICHCGSCHRRFMELHGMELPATEDWSTPAFPRWRAYTRQVLDDIAARIREFIKERNPGTALILRQNSDVAFQEVNNAVDRPQPLWINWAGEAVREARTARPDTPIMVNSVMFLDLPYRFVAEQPGLLELHLNQTIACGGNPSAYMLGTPDVFDDDPIFAAVGDVLRFHQNHEQYFADARSLARVLLISSMASQEHFGDNGADRVTNEARGIYRALVESHIPFDILPADRLVGAAESGSLNQYGAIILPNVAVLDDPQTRLLDGFVQSGGGLVATYETSTTMPDGTRRDAFGLDSLGVARIVRRRDQAAETRSAYLRASGGDSDTQPHSGKLICIDDGFIEVEPRSGATGSLPFVPPGRYGPPEKCYWHHSDETEHPGLIKNRFGDGRTCFLPWPVGSLYYRLNQPDHRDLLAGALDYVTSGGRQVETDAPPQVEVVLNAQANEHRTLVHLINYSGHEGRAFHPPLEIRDLNLTLPPSCCGPGTKVSAHAVRFGSDLKVSNTESGRFSVTLPSLTGHELIVIEEQRS